MRVCVCVYMCESRKKGRGITLELNSTARGKLERRSSAINRIPFARIILPLIVCLSTKKGSSGRSFSPDESHELHLSRGIVKGFVHLWHRRHQMLTSFGRPPASLPPPLPALSPPSSLSFLQALSKLEVLESLRYRLINATSYLLK